MEVGRQLVAQAVLPWNLLNRLQHLSLVRARQELHPIRSLDSNRPRLLRQRWKATALVILSRAGF